MNDHAVANGSLARWDKLGNSFDLNETNPAGSGNREARMITVTGQFITGVLTGLQNHLAFFAVDEFAVYGDLGHSVGMVHEDWGKFTKDNRFSYWVLNLLTGIGGRPFNRERF
jgi:hypothetical protein